jgi:hypothetical protein
MMLNTLLKKMLSTSNDPLRKLLVKTPKSVTNDFGDGFLSRLF